MKNIIEFYYNLKIEKLHNKNDQYFFSIADKNFVFKPYDDDERKLQDIYYLNLQISPGGNFDKIIINKQNNLITKIDNIPYILILTSNKRTLSLPEISNISNNTNIDTRNIQNLERNGWETLWSNKIDYFEMQVEENKKKFPLIRESFDYFIGMGENAISYLVNTKKEERITIYDQKVIAHNNLYQSLYEPTNLILDHKARDIAEYIKLSFFNNNTNIFKQLDEYFYYNYYSKYGMRVLFSRILYPSFYFNLYEDIISEKIEEKELNKILDKTEEYETFLYDVYLYLKKYYDIPPIEWLKKQGF